MEPCEGETAKAGEPGRGLKRPKWPGWGTAEG